MWSFSLFQDLTEVESHQVIAYDITRIPSVAWKFDRTCWWSHEIILSLRKSKKALCVKHIWPKTPTNLPVYNRLCHSCAAFTTLRRPAVNRAVEKWFICNDSCHVGAPFCSCENEYFPFSWQMHPSARRVNRDGARGAESVLMIPLQFPAGRDLGRLSAHVVMMNRPGFPLEVTLTITLTSACCDDLITPVSNGR